MTGSNVFIYQTVGKRSTALFVCRNLIKCVIILCLGFGTDIVPKVHSANLDYSQDILPVLSDHCFQCHGPDEKQRKADLRLDALTGAVAVLDGHSAIVPGNPAQSELIRRIHSEDPDLVMPPPESDLVLNQSQKKLLEQWIQSGAVYEKHWAYQSSFPDKPPTSDVSGQWPKNDMDHFVLKRILENGLQPSPVAKRETLIRRLCLDLTGLPPTLREIDEFVGDPIPGAYERLVDRLLQSPHYGERMAIDWLDAARYADTNGYQVDRDREMYAWRDWVIRAFNTNMPFDVFTVEQLAGDLLPNPTIDQLIASGFNRNHMMNEEGGIIPEEFLAEYCADRVETTATIWLGQTFVCARCHDHKYDPFTQKDYYSIYAFFHNISEQGRGNYGASIRRNNSPMIQLPAPKLEKIRDQLGAELDTLKKTLERETEESEARPGIEKNITELKKRYDQADLAIPTTLVMKELSEPRPTYILLRGAYDNPGEQVSPNTPESLPAMDDHLPRNRLGLARWLVSPDNPLTARVTVNRLWQSVFGEGLVRTPEDFGTRGEAPSHPELLDWLASTFVRSGWDVKALIRLMVTSATYRQSSIIKSEHFKLDPSNRWLARAFRHRLQAEFLRDQALEISGLLVKTIGGPSVKPYHPPGLYEQVAAGRGTNKYVQDQDDGLFRRTMYSYWKRSVPNPAMLTFDMPFRETCVVRRSRTNTPMQALNLMNDTTYVEAAKFLAKRMLEEVGEDMDDRLVHGFRLVTARFPSSAELSQLRSTTQRSIQEFKSHPDEAKSLLATGEARSVLPASTEEQAGYMVAASLLLNLDETVNRE